MNEANRDTIVIRCKNQTAALKKGFAENALIPNAYGAGAFGMESRVMIMPELCQKWSISVKERPDRPHGIHPSTAGTRNHSESEDGAFWRASSRDSEAT